MHAGMAFFPFVRLIIFEQYTDLLGYVFCISTPIIRVTYFVLVYLLFGLLILY